MPLFPTTRPRAGFTIVELLFVFSALAILLSLILSLFGRVRDMSYRTQCACNLRQLGCAFNLYSNDWNGYWPCPGGLVGDRSYWSQSGPGGLNPYIKQRGLSSVWCCPGLTEWHGKFPPRSYSMNSNLREAPDGTCDIPYPPCVDFLSGIRVNRILQPQRTILLYEGIPRSREFEDKAYTEDQIFYIYRCTNWTWVRGYYKYTHTIDSIHPWHGRVNNYLYCDGHVLARKPGKRTYAEFSTRKEMYEWYVNKGTFAYNCTLPTWRNIPPE